MSIAPKHELMICMCIIMGCTDRSWLEGYKNTIRHGIQSIPHVTEIRRLFPDAPTDHFITNYNIEKQKPHVWNTEVFFGGRYTLTYEVDVVINYNEHRYNEHRIEKVVSSGKFNLRSFARIAQGDGDFDRFEWDRHFGETEWNKVVEAGGDLSVIGIRLDLKSPPIPGWDDYVRRWSEPRIKVEP